MYTISKEFHVCSSHVLEGLPAGHPCGRLHGHNYVITVELEGDALDEHGFVLDYGALTAGFGKWLEGVMDHRHLNDVFTFQPSAENLAAHLYRIGVSVFALPIARVGVSETPKTMAWYSPWNTAPTSNEVAVAISEDAVDELARRLVAEAVAEEPQ